MAMKTSKNLTITNARLIYQNFQGVASKYNPSGRRNFCVLLDDKQATSMIRSGWDVKYLHGSSRPFIQVSIADDYVLDDDLSVGGYVLLGVVEVTISPSPWTVGEKSGIRAYLQSINTYPKGD